MSMDSAANLIRIVLPYQEAPRFFLWTPTLIALGIALYFSLSFEPDATYLVGVAFLLGVCAVSAYLGRTHLHILTVIGLLFCVLLGFGASMIRTHVSGTPMLKQAQKVWLEGIVLKSEQLIGGDRRIVVQLPEKEYAPKRVQLRVKQKQALLPVGARISFLAKIAPLPRPIEPYGFDYARSLFFKGIGASGYTLTTPEITELPSQHALEQLRGKITQRIYRASAPGEGGVLAALITGEKTAIDPAVVTALQNSGIAHILAISGLHMALFCGVVFWLVRALAAFSPAVSLRWPVKKMAAVFALVSGLFYLTLSGYGIATQRSFIMISFVFFAIILDRPIISLRNVAIAAIALLLMEPESLLSASFQMSFSAVVGLVSLYENASDLYQPKNALLRYITNLLIASTVASVFTAPFSAFHFHRLAMYGVATNMVAIPAMGFVIMPAALFGLLFMPLGLESWPLAIMGKGLEFVQATARVVASWPGAVIYVKQGSMAALVCLTLGGLWGVVWRQPARRALGLVLAVVGISIWAIDRRPDLLIEEQGRVVGRLDTQGKRVLTGIHPLYVTKNWLLADGDSRPAPQAKSLEGWHLDASLVNDINTAIARQEGAQAVWLGQNGGVRARYTVQEVRGKRPWT